MASGLMAVDIRPPCTLALRAECQSAQMSKITNDSLTQDAL